MKRIAFLLLYTVILSVSNVYASPTCKIFNDSNPSQHGQYVLAIVDAKLTEWPQNKKMKTMVSASERIDMFKDSIQKITYFCKNNQDFKAGLALGEDLFLYKKMLLELR